MDIERQLRLEDESVEMDVRRYHAERALPWRDDTAAKKEDSDLPPGQALLRKVVGSTAQALTEILEGVRKGRAGAGNHSRSSDIVGSG